MLKRKCDVWGQVQQEERDQIIAAKIKQLAFTKVVSKSSGADYSSIHVF